MEMDEENQRDTHQIEVQLKVAFSNDAFTAYRKLTLVRWSGEQVDIYTNRIKQLIGLAGFKVVGLERINKLTFITGFPDAISIRLQ